MFLSHEAYWLIPWVFSSKFTVKWCENDQTNALSADEIVRAVDVLQPGTKINVIVPNKNFYDEMMLESYVEDGQHLVKGKRGQIFA